GESAAPADGLSVLSGDSTVRPTLFPRAAGSGGGAGRVDGSLFLPQCEIDPGTSARPATAGGPGGPSAAEAPQPPRRFLFRSLGYPEGAVVLSAEETAC